METFVRYEDHLNCLAAISVAANANTRTTANGNRIASSNPAYTAALGDVYKAIDREMDLRENLEELKKQHDHVSKELNAERAYTNRLRQMLEVECQATHKLRDKNTELIDENLTLLQKIKNLEASNQPKPLTDADAALLDAAIKVSQVRVKHGDIPWLLTFIAGINSLLVKKGVFTQAEINESTVAAANNVSELCDVHSDTEQPN